MKERLCQQQITDVLSSLEMLCAMFKMVEVLNLVKQQKNYFSYFLITDKANKDIYEAQLGTFQTVTKNVGLH